MRSTSARTPALRRGVAQDVEFGALTLYPNAPGVGSRAVGNLSLVEAPPHYQESWVDGCVVRVYDGTPVTDETVSIQYSATVSTMAFVPSDNDYAFTSTAPVLPGASITFTASSGAFPAFTTNLSVPPSVAVTTPGIPQATGMGALAAHTPIVLSWTGSPALVRARLLAPLNGTGYVRATCDFAGGSGSAVVPRAALDAMFALPNVTALNMIVGSADVATLAVDGHWVEVEVMQLVLSCVVEP